MKEKLQKSDHTFSANRLSIRKERDRSEQESIGHLIHTLSPKLSGIKSVVDLVLKKGVSSQYDFNVKSLQDPLEQSEPTETIGEALEETLSNIDFINSYLKDYETSANKEIEPTDFEKVNLKNLLKEILHGLGKQNFKINYTISSDAQFIELHKRSFIEAINNIIANARRHAFKESKEGNEINFSITERGTRICIDYWNNGIPFPEEITIDNFLSAGDPSMTSGGGGWGGSSLGRLKKIHNGEIRIIRDTKHSTHLQIFLPKDAIYHHISGHREWDAYSKAKYLYELNTNQNMTIQEISDYIGAKQIDTERSIQAYIESFNEDGILSVSAAETNHLIKEHRIHSCPDTYSYKETKYITFRMPPNGAMSEIYKIEKIVRVPLNIINKFYQNQEDLFYFYNDLSLTKKEANRLTSYIYDNPFRKNLRFYFLSEWISLPHKPKPKEYTIEAKYYTTKELLSKPSKEDENE